jgi:hypothetical protein
LVLAVALSAVVLRWVDPGEEESARPPARPPAPTSTAATPDGVTEAAARNDAVTRLLAERARAIRNGDKAAFLATVDPVAVQFRARQSQLFDRMARVPLGRWDYDLAGTGPALPDARTEQLPSGSWIGRVIARYSYGDRDSPVDREQYLTFVPRGDLWLIGGDADGEPSGLPSEKDIWDLGPIRVVTGERSIVIGSPRHAPLRRYADEADQGVVDVGKVWRRPWSRQPVVLVPRTQSDMTTLIGSDGAGLEQIAAVTTGLSESGITRGDRVVINPAAWKTLGSLGRRVVMTHELTHLATRAQTRRSVPLWLSEGLADYVANAAVDVPVDLVGDDILDQVRAGRLPKDLPEDSEFDAGEGEIAPAYEGSWLVARLIAQRYGEEKLIRLYLRTADDRGSPAEDLQQVLGLTERQLVRQWRAYLLDLAAG